MTNLSIPPKPEGSTWTDDQWKAITATGRDILVAAAAGSGKTAVLVERIIRKITSVQEPLDVDEILVVTFTNASAAEMRHRIGEALERAIDANPSSGHLRKQLSLLNRASISTLHSFCLEVIRKFYYLIDVDPAFRIADETEGQLLRDEVIDELFEEEYGKKGNTAFFNTVDTFTNDRSDEALKDIIFELYDFARSNPFPDKYLDSIMEMYNVQPGQPIESLPFTEVLMLDIGLALEGAKELLNQGLELTKLPAGPAPRAQNFIEDIEMIDALLAAQQESWSALFEAMQIADFKRAKACSPKEYDKDLIEKAAKLRDKAKKTIQDLKSELFTRRPESFLKDMQDMNPVIETLIGLVKEFSRRFAAVKQEKGLVDFSDLEHYTLEILSEKEAKEGQLVPSEAGLSYRKRFKEVLVDEYQDTNMVQEAILQLVTIDGEHCGNLFMVGDVKQSIYRFRLAEPNLFLRKYMRFTSEGAGAGLKIDLAKNFRSRGEVLAGTNYIFKQIMGVRVGEIEYDENAELKKGAAYPEAEVPVELLVIDQSAEEEAPAISDDPADEAVFDAEELEQSQLEARLMANKIREMIDSRVDVYNPKTKQDRPIKYRDIVILVRSMTWTPQFMEEFKQHGIPSYANLSTGYFEATEVAIMLSLLKVLDNPHQDIPLASVLRSPIVGLDEEQLAKIRVQNKRGSYYEALTDFCADTHESEDDELSRKTAEFFARLKEWRSKARKESVSSLIWDLYRETRFYDFVGGMPGGKQRQANLRALYDRARQYEATSFRGLFRFLRFIDRMRERGDDLGAAGAIGEQEDVVRIMTIHSSKGLEFPVVFVAGLGRKFNTMDLKKPFMLDKDFGFAAKYVDPNKRITYTSLPQMAFKRKKKMEMLAEEMRILYVALTRAKERLYLLSSVKGAPKQIEKWAEAAKHPDWLLADHLRASAGSYLDWIGPAVARHRDSADICGEIAAGEGGEVQSHDSRWAIRLYTRMDIESFFEEQELKRDNRMDQVKAFEPIGEASSYADAVRGQLLWTYGHEKATVHRSKQSVTELKRNHESRDEESSVEILRSFSKPLLERPRFMQEKTLSPAERGTAMHMVMQHLDLGKPLTKVSILDQIQDMAKAELLYPEQTEAVEADLILSFFETNLGKRMLSADKIHREVPFYLSLRAGEVYPDWREGDQPIFVQGVVDCLFEDEEGLVLVDFKTDRVEGRFKGFEQAKPVLEERYRIQLDLYARAIEQIWRKPVTERYLFFFDGGHLLQVGHQ